MITVVGVRFKKAGKIYYFDPDHLDIQKGDNVIVETARGIEFGHVVIGKREVAEEDIVSPLKKVLRIATSEDVAVHQDNKEKNCDTFKICEEKIKAHALEMKLIDVEYTFDNNKVIFYFTADGRIDFRELVKDLAAVFKTRIELRQIGVRDEAKMVNGIGPCGIGLCCANWLGDFAPVSIKMAKDQNLSLNPTKISGICGRLMCCLKYEHDTYLSLRKGMPNKGDRIMTVDGPGVVFDTNILLEQVKVRPIIKDRDEQPELSEDLVIYKKDQIKSILKKSQVQEDAEDVVIENVDDIPPELLAEIGDELKPKSGKKCGSCAKNKPRPNREPLSENALKDSTERAKTFSKVVAEADGRPNQRNNRNQGEGAKDGEKKYRPRPERKPKRSLEEFSGELDAKHQDEKARQESPRQDNPRPQGQRPNPQGQSGDRPDQGQRNKNRRFNKDRKKPSGEGSKPQSEA